MTDQLLTENEVRRCMFSKEARPSRQAMARIRREYDLPHVRLGRRVLYWRDELESHLNQFHRPKPGDEI